jgi:hypothetical protein
VAWRRCSRRCRRSRRRGCSCSGPAPSPNADGLLSSPRGGGCGLRPWRVGGVPVRPRFPSTRRSGGAPFSLPLTAHSLEKKKGKTPNGGWWLGCPGLSLPLPLKPGAANVEAKAPSCPGFDRPGGRGGTAPPPLRRLRCRGARCGGKRGNSHLGPGSTRVHARTGPSACGPAGRGGCPIPRARPRRGSPGAVRIRGRGKEGEDRGERLTDTWAQTVGG